MNDAASMMAASSICHAADMVKISWQQSAAEYERPSVVFRPRLTPDGDKWCALFGENLQEGVAGFGDTPAQAMWDFDRQWITAKTPDAIRSANDE